MIRKPMLLTRTQNCLPKGLGCPVSAGKGSAMISLVLSEKWVSNYALSVGKA